MRFIRSARSGESRTGRRTLTLAVASGAALALALAGTASASATATPAAPAGVKMASLNPAGAGVAAPDLASGNIATCAKVAAKAGFSFNVTVSTALGQEPQIVVALSVAMAESSCNGSATNDNTNGSEDRGLWQINNAAWPNVSNTCAFQVQCNADAAWNISDKGGDWQPWSTFDSGVWENYVSDAKAAINDGFDFQLKSDSGGDCLDADSSNVGNGGKIFQWACNSSDSYQLWTVESTVGSLFILKNNGSGTCLDVDGSDVGKDGKIFQWACSKTDSAQEWWFRGSGQLNTNGNANAGLEDSYAKDCVDVDSADVANGGTIMQYTCSGSDGFQLWN
ncbi:MAG TPA: RICIN domain-containing protein [Actinocrinis sp.]|jgi:hypothetical protein